MQNFRTDMADERNNLYKQANGIQDNVEGVETEENNENENIKTTIVKITNEKGEQAIGKPVGMYVTIDVKNLRIATEDDIVAAAEVMSRELKKIVQTHIESMDETLVVGLGNRFMTPDSLGPKVISDIEITRHYIKYTPQYVKEGTRSVSAVAPGVLGTTGIETLEILKGIVDNVKPKMLIAVDSLASNNIERISTTIQIADTGIVPGGGVGNERKELSLKTLGIPVIAIGVPMVKPLPEDENFIVTPKEIDELITNMSNVVARGINLSL